MNDNKFTEKIGLFLSIVFVNTMSINIILAIVERDKFYYIFGIISTILMFIGFWIYCSSNNE